MRISGRAFLVLSALVVLAVIYATGQIAPAESAYQAQMRVWLAARATGIAALVLLTLQVVLGLVLSHPTNQATWRLSKRIFPWHEHLLLFTASLLAIHIVSLVVDPYAGVGIGGALIPGLSEYRSSAVALGTLAVYALIATSVTARYTRLLPAGVWLKLHRLSLVVLILAWLHGVLAGSDSDALRRALRRLLRPGRGGRGTPLLGQPPHAARLAPVRHRGRHAITSRHRAGHRDVRHARHGHHRGTTRRRRPMKVLVRRTTTVTAVILAIVIGALSIEAAAAAVRASAPPVGPAVTVQSIEAQLEQERTRSQALRGQLRQLTDQSTTLAASLLVANDQVVTDAATATALRADLARAKRQLAKLQRQMAASAAAAAKQARAATTSRSSGGGGGGGCSMRRTTIDGSQARPAGRRLRCHDRPVCRFPGMRHRAPGRPGP